MDPPQPPSPPQSTVNSVSTKLRLMCSYGGQIIPRPRTKSLCYLGGETRIISVDHTTINTLAAFISHLLTILTIKPPFTLKYQLPHSGLDSLISLSSDDDLQFMLCEHLRLSSSSSLASAPSRIRLFIFFPEPEKTTTYNVIHHPKTEAWFVDALKSAKILQKGRDCLVGYDGEGLTGDNEAKTVGDLGNGAVSLPESMILETSSSFGSSSSSASLANVPPIKPQNEDFGFSSLDNAVKLTTSESVATLASEIATTNSCSSVENAVMSIPVISESSFHDPAAGILPQNAIDFSGYALGSRPPFPQQALQYVQAGAPVENCLPAMFPMASYYPVQQPQFLHYQQMPNHMYPVYFLPAGQTQVSAPSNLPMQWGLRDASTRSSSHASVPLDASPVLPRVVYKEVMSEPRSQNYGATSFPNPTALEPVDEVQQQSVSISNDAAASGEVPRSHNEGNDDPARAQIYKSQPPPPPLVPSQLQSKTKASTTPLSDALAQLQMIQIKQ